MAKVITFSRQFPSYHPRVGEPTLFVEKFQWAIWSQVGDKYRTIQDCIIDLNKHLPKKLINSFLDSLDIESDFHDAEKHHTVRAGHRFKVGDWFSPRVWSGKPYNSKQIIIAPDIQVLKTWDFYLMGIKEMGDVNIYGFINEEVVPTDKAILLAKNDGLETDDFESWFCPNNKKIKINVPFFEGQIICWNESIEY